MEGQRRGVAVAKQESERERHASGLLFCFWEWGESVCERY